MIQGGRVVSCVRVLDPLLVSSWVHQGSLSCEDIVQLFKHCVCDQMIVTTVVCHHFHWLPILLVPAGLRVHIISSDHSDGIPAWLVNRLTGFVFALGFHRVSCDHEVRDFPCRSVCGAVSFNFIGFRLGLCPRVTKYSAVWHLHGYLGKTTD